MNAQPLVVRFQEYLGYDINVDGDVCTFLATTDRGSYHAEVLIATPRELREARERFRERALDCMRKLVEPCEIQVSDDG